MALASLRDVRFTYSYTDEPALDGITLELEEGLLHGVVGMNASGKSTLCSLIRGIVPYFHEGELEGEVMILGRNLLDWDPAELSRTIGCVFENPFTQISGIKDTVFEEIALGLENLGIPRDAMIERVERVVEQLGLQALIKKNPNELSGGQRQKVAFASIIAMDADFIVIDEPTSQLDPEASEAVFAIIGDLKAAGKTIVLVEHKIDLMAQYADRLVVMNHGRIVANGPTRDVLTSAAFADACVPVPEVTELSFQLREAGKELPFVPITRLEAFDAITQRMNGAKSAY
ncbi:MAG: energy-coupling factor ABC transporter ATP-binding protein [Rhodoglobus sp.]